MKWHYNIINTVYGQKLLYSLHKKVFIYQWHGDWHVWATNIKVIARSNVTMRAKTKMGGLYNNDAPAEGLYAFRPRNVIISLKVDDRVLNI